MEGNVGPAMSPSWHPVADPLRVGVRQLRDGPTEAPAGSDYINATGTLQFYPGTLTKTIYVPVLDDTVGEKTESFYVDLSVPLNGTLTRSRDGVDRQRRRLERGVQHGR